MLTAEQFCKLKEEIRRLQEMVEKQDQYLKSGEIGNKNALLQKKNLLVNSDLLKVRVTEMIDVGTKFTLKMIGQDPKDVMLVEKVLDSDNPEEFICKSSSLGQLLFGKHEGDFVLKTYEKGNTVVLGRIEEIKKDLHDYVNFIRVEDQKRKYHISDIAGNELRLLKATKDTDLEARQKWESWQTITDSQQQLLKEEAKRLLSKPLTKLEKHRITYIRQILSEKSLAVLPQDGSIGVGSEFSIIIQTDQGLVTKRVEMVNRVLSDETDNEYVSRTSSMGYRIFGLKEQETFQFYSGKFGQVKGVVFDIDNVKKNQKTSDPTLYHVRNVKKYGLVREQKILLEAELAQKVKILEMKRSSRKKDGYAFLDNSEINDLKIRIAEITGMLKQQNIIENPNSDMIDIGSSFSLSLDYGNGEVEELEAVLVPKFVSNEASCEHFVSMEADLGKAIYEKGIGDNFSCLLPNGNTLCGQVLTIVKSDVLEKAPLKKGI